MVTDAQKTRYEEQLRAWWQASRPPFFIATLVPVFLALIVAARDSGTWYWGTFFLMLLICFLLHLSANLANDLFDHLQGIDAGLNIGGSRVIQQGKITPNALQIALLILFSAVVALSGIGIYTLGRYWLAAVVLFAMFSTLFYVAPPIKYGHRAMGELFVFLNMGVTMVAGGYYALTGTMTSEILALSLPVGLMVAGILYFQSLPEIETDKAAGKYTLANVLGPEKATLLFYLWWPVIWLMLIGLWLKGYCSWLVLWGVFGSIPLHIRACARVREAHGNWLSLDTHGHLVRKMYLLCGVTLIFSVLFAKWAVE